MAEQTDNVMAMMPPAEQIAVEAISLMAVDGFASLVMKIARPTLNEVARRLATPGVRRSEVMAWLNSQVTPAIDDNAFYRFAQRWAECYRRVWGEHSTRHLLASLAANPEFDSDALADFNRRRVMQLVGQELVEARTPSELDTKRFRALMMAIRASDQTQFDRDRISLAKQLAEQRAAESEARVEKLTLENAKQRERQQQAVKEAEQVVAKGGDSKAVVNKVRELLGLPRQEGAA